MLAQIFLGVIIVIMQISRWKNLNTTSVNDAVKQNISEDKIESFQKAQILPHFLLGIVLIFMGVIEGMDIISTPNLIRIYIALGFILLSWVLINNKRYSGKYFLR